MPHGILFATEQVGLFAAATADPAPASRHGDVAEQGRVEAENVESLHACRRVDPPAMKIEHVFRHGRRVSRAHTIVQRLF